MIGAGIAIHITVLGILYMQADPAVLGPFFVYHVCCLPAPACQLDSRIQEHKAAKAVGLSASKLCADLPAFRCRAVQKEKRQCRRKLWRTDGRTYASPALRFQRFASTVHCAPCEEEGGAEEEGLTKLDVL